MRQWKRVKALPYFRECNRGDKCVRDVLRRQPSQDFGVRTGFANFADDVRVQHEIHSETRRTSSFGMRGGSQSVKPRMESYHAITRRMDWARNLRWPGLLEWLVASRADSHASSCLASLGDNPFTFRMAVSTALTWLI